MNTNEGELLESGLTNVEVAETGETETNNYSFTCECEHVDYTDQLEALILQSEYIANSNAQLVSNNLFVISFVFGFGICFILYKFLKIFL